MPLAPGTRLGFYEIGAQAGKGGMGEVYVARDSKLGRDVAIKVLPESVASEPARLARFEREARVLASLNHPHIAQIYGLEHADGAPALVMELVDGPTLADHIAGNRISLRETLRIARQIAEALEAAHEQGIVHRDLKPSNIKLTSRGDIKVLDFGLATMREADPERLADLPTHEISSANAIVGTPAYMAPEQAKGEPATHAVDIWAFGCVLFALISGKPPFGGTTTTEILAEVLKSEPDWDRLPAHTPPAVRRTLRRCLAKDLHSRFHHIADVRLALEDVEEGPSIVHRSPWRERAAWILASVSIAAAATFFAQRSADPAERRFDIVTPPEADAGGIALSPDGTNIAYTALAKGVPYLYVRSLEDGSVRTLANTQGAALPFWSPAGDALAFFAESRLKRVNLASGGVQTLATATLSPAGGSWNSDSTIVFAPNIRGRVLRVSAEGGEVSEVVPEGRSPRFLSDGRRFVFLDLSGVKVGSLDSGDVQQLRDDIAWFALPGPPGYLTFMKRAGRGRLFIQPFDEETLTLSGVETVIAEQVQTATDGISASATISRTGIIAVREVTGEVQPRRISEFDRKGTEIRRFGELGGLSPSASPDFDYVAVSRATGGNAVYLLELARGILTPFTSGPADQAAIWSPDGRHIVFSTARRGSVEMFIKPANGGDERPLIESPPDTNSRVATDWMQDLLLFRENSTTTNFDVYALPMSGSDRRPIAIVRTNASERDAQFSPDMKWVAYESDKSGRSEIYVTRYRGPGREFQISPDGGAQVRWNPSNRNELFYVALDGRLMSIRLEFTADDASVRASDPVTLFQTRIGTVLQGPQKQQYVVSRDGQRFLVSNVIEEALSPIRLILNWKPRNN